MSIRSRGYVRLVFLLIVLCGISCVGPTHGTDDQRPFTIVMLPDTQHYSKSHPDRFYAQTEWIKQNRDKENIVFVTHLGDIVNDRTKAMSQWAVASEAMVTLDGVVPWGVAIGNHDYDTDMIAKGGATVWVERFGPQRFEGCEWFGGVSPNQLNSYQLFSAGGLDFIILHLEVNVPGEAMAWAQDILKRYPTRAAIIATHVYIKGKDGLKRDPDRRYRKDGHSGEEIWDKLVRVNPQIFMVLCAHVTHAEEFYQISVNDAGHKVFEMLADYQGRANGGDGWLRLIRFVPASRQIQVRTYSPSLDRFETDASSQFTIPWDLPDVCRGGHHGVSGPGSRKLLQ